MYVFRTEKPITERQMMKPIHIEEEKYYCYEFQNYFCYSHSPTGHPAHMIDYHKMSDQIFILEVGDGYWHSTLFAKYLSTRYDTGVLIATLPDELNDERVKAVSPHATLFQDASGYGQYIRFEVGDESVMMRFDRSSGEFHVGIPLSQQFKAKLMDFLVKLVTTPLLESM